MARRYSSTVDKQIHSHTAGSPQSCRLKSRLKQSPRRIVAHRHFEPLPLCRSRRRAPSHSRPSNFWACLWTKHQLWWICTWADTSFQWRSCRFRRNTPWNCRCPCLARSLLLLWEEGRLGSHIVEASRMLIACRRYRQRMREWSGEVQRETPLTEMWAFFYETERRKPWIPSLEEALWAVFD